MFCNDAELEGTVTASENGTELPPGVMVAGVKRQVAPDGSELCAHESVMGWCGLPVFAFRDSE